MATPPDIARQLRLARAAVQPIDGGPAANDAVEDWHRIERIITRMEADGLGKQAQVLRVHYLWAHRPEAERLHRLRREGLNIGRTAYYIYLDAAHAYIAGALSAEAARPCA